MALTAHHPRVRVNALLSVVLVVLAACGEVAAQASPTATTRQQSSAPQATGVPLASPTTSPSAAPPGIWCRDTGPLALDPACEIVASAYDAQQGEYVVAEMRDPQLTVSARVYGPWALVASCAPDPDLHTSTLTVYSTLEYAGSLWYSWGAVPCAMTAPSTYFEFRRSASGTVTIHLEGVPVGEGGIGPAAAWDILLVQR
jgi:hypothetical protein